MTAESMNAAPLESGFRATQQRIRKRAMNWGQCTPSGNAVRSVAHHPRIDDLRSLHASRNVIERQLFRHPRADLPRESNVRSFLTSRRMLRATTIALTLDVAIEQLSNVIDAPRQSARKLPRENIKLMAESYMQASVCKCSM